ncbi:MAG: sigma-70 family RNA polymerase sigma factor [Prevotella sp.]|nr:sigma-70 family RNA polymerase sigma factor [Prevotella sp.]
MKETETRFSQMVREQRSTIYTVCYMFSNNEEEVNDLFQEVLLHLWQGFERFEGRSDVKTWVYRIALNTCVSIDRKKRRRPVLTTLKKSFNLFEDHDENTRQVAQLHQRIGRLQPVDRALVLLWLEDMSYDEISQITGLTVKNVSVRLYRIKEELKKMNNHETGEH